MGGILSCCVSPTEAYYVPNDMQWKVKEKGVGDAKLTINREGEWKWNYAVPEQPGVSSAPKYAALERKMMEVARTDPAFAIVPEDRLKRHFAKFNQQIDSNGQVIEVRKPDLGIRGTARPF